MTTDRLGTRRRVLRRGGVVEVWENPDVPFAWSLRAFEQQVARGDWVLVFNVLALANGRIYSA
jgi:hypothetical protein